MIDFEQQAFTAVRTKVIAVDSTTSVKSETDLSPKKFPCVCFEEVGNSVYTSTSDSSNIERHALVSFEANIYSNKTSGKKTKAKELAEAVDEAMNELGIERISKNIQYFDDSTKVRIILRYRGVISQSGEVYRR